MSLSVYIALWVMWLHYWTHYGQFQKQIIRISTAESEISPLLSHTFFILF